MILKTVFDEGEYDHSHLFIPHTFINTYCVPGTVFNAGVTKINKIQDRQIRSMSQEDKVPVLGNGRDSGALEATFSPRLGQPFLSACSFLPGEKAGPVSPGLWFFFFKRSQKFSSLMLNLST